MEDLSEMLVLDGIVANLGDIDEGVLKQVVDAHVAERGHRMPEWAPTEEDVIVITGDEGEHATGESTAPREEEGQGGNEEPAGCSGSDNSEFLSELVTDEVWAELLGQDVANTERQEGGQVMEDQAMQEGDGDLEVCEDMEGIMGVTVTDEELQRYLAEYCREVEGETQRGEGTGQ